MVKSDKIDFLGIPVDNLTMKETVSLVDNTISENNHIQHVVVNAGKVAAMQKDKQLFNDVISADLINADGQAIVWASRILNCPLPERVAGIDLMQNLVELAHKKSYKIFFFGAKEEIVKGVVDKYSKQYSDKIIAGYRNGYFSEEEEPEIAKQISESGANILFVAISSPKKEHFINTYSILKKVNFTMGVGGSFDVVAGKVRRAPMWMQKIGLEWFYRMIQEPGRMWKRYLVGNTNFIILILKTKLKRKK
jgi:N-acetylglucosaminyldiphosphoundecaprenol N-acetyl-beta-D-mannosaminyltransferase